jgi:hypothetical protein
VAKAIITMTGEALRFAGTGIGSVSGISRGKGIN